MAFRTIVIKSRCKLEYSLNYLVCRGEDEKKILLDEIELIIIQNIQVSLTCSLLSALAEKKIKVIFCDAKHNPQSELVPYYNNYCSYKKILQQFNFDNEIKNEIWSRIIYEKIYNQARILKKLKLEQSEKLEKYLNEIENGDITNREGHAAKVYFNSIWGNSFCRTDDSNPINKYLNYGYSIIVSMINREIKSLGYLTELGVHHIGETNPFNLSYDLVEPLRSYIDWFVIKEIVNEDNYKPFFAQLLSSDVIYSEHVMHFDNAIHLYVQSIFNALINKNANNITFIKYEL